MSEENIPDEKEEALRQINEIKSHLVDKQTFFPYNYNATYVWSVIAAILTFIVVPMYERSIETGTLILFVLISLGFISEGIMTKKVNKDYDIDDCTIRQQFLMKNFMMISFFLIILSTILAQYKLYIPMYLSWLSLISIGFFSMGHVLNIKPFSIMAQFNILVSMILLSVALYQENLAGTDNNYFYVVQFMLILGLSIIPFMIAWKQKKILKTQLSIEDEV